MTDWQCESNRLSDENQQLRVIIKDELNWDDEAIDGVLKRIQEEAGK